MAQRKDMMRIIRQDAGFSAKLGFGGAVAEDPNAVPTTVIEVVAKLKPEAVAVTTSPCPIGSEGAAEKHCIETEEEARKEKESQRVQPNYLTRSNDAANCAATGSDARGQVIYVAVSLTTRQAHLAEAWAKAARCSVQFLIRRVAQGLREQVFDDWDRDGMPDVDEPRGTRTKHPTSVTLTLRPQFAADLTAKHDPLGMLGLGRAMGPAFRARFQEAFDLALAKAKIQTTLEGDEK
jgi:hypothetical protein